ncbi:MAG: flagellar hook-length control protein FliK [Gammaproteobacteria bacterium]
MDALQANQLIVPSSIASSFASGDSNLSNNPTNTSMASSDKLKTAETGLPQDATASAKPFEQALALELEGLTLAEAAPGLESFAAAPLEDIPGDMLNLNTAQDLKTLELDFKEISEVLSEKDKYPIGGIETGLLVSEIPCFSVSPVLDANLDHNQTIEEIERKEATKKSKELEKLEDVLNNNSNNKMPDPVPMIPPPIMAEEKQSEVKTQVDTEKYNDKKNNQKIDEFNLNQANIKLSRNQIGTTEPETQLETPLEINAEISMALKNFTALEKSEKTNQTFEQSSLEAINQNFTQAVLWNENGKINRENGQDNSQQMLSLSIEEPIYDQAGLNKKWTEQFIDRISFLVGSKINHAYLEVHPENLGPIEIKLEIEEKSKKLELQIITSSNEVKALVQSNLQKLESNLSEQGLSLGNASVFYNEKNQGQNSEQDQRNANGFPYYLLGSTEENTEEAGKLMANAKKLSSNQIDYHV